MSNEAERTSSNGAGAWSNIVKENPLFQKYYKDGLGICKNEEEWQSFVQHLKDPLPINFRFTGSRSTSFELRDLMKSMYFEPLSKLTLANGKKVSPPQELEWYPNSLGWQFNMERSQIKVKTPWIIFSLPNPIP